MLIVLPLRLSKIETCSIETCSNISLVPGSTNILLRPPARRTRARPRSCDSASDCVLRHLLHLLLCHRHPPRWARAGGHRSWHWPQRRRRRFGPCRTDRPTCTLLTLRCTDRHPPRRPRAPAQSLRRAGCPALQPAGRCCQLKLVHIFPLTARGHRRGPVPDGRAGHLTRRERRV